MIQFCQLPPSAEAKTKSNSSPPSQTPPATAAPQNPKTHIRSKDSTPHPQRWEDSSARVPPRPDPRPPRNGEASGASAPRDQERSLSSFGRCGECGESGRREAANMSFGPRKRRISHVGKLEFHPWLLQVMVGSRKTPGQEIDPGLTMHVSGSL